MDRRPGSGPAQDDRGGSRPPGGDRDLEVAASFVEGLGAFVWEADAATFRFTYVSPEAERILGYPRSRWLEEPGFWVRHLHPADREEAVERCRRATDEGRDHVLEYRMIAADGREVWLRDLVQVVRDAAGRTRLRGLMIDVTASRRTEERYRSIFENAVEGIFATTLDGRYLLANPALARMAGYGSPEELVREVTDVASVYVDPDARRRLIRAVDERGAVMGFEAEARRRDGSPLRVSENVWAVRDAHGRLVGLEGTVLDVTERKRMEEELRRSEARYRLLFERNPQPMWVVDVESLRLVAANDAALRLYGYARGEFIGASIEAILRPEDVPQVLARLRSARPAVHRVGRRVHRRKDGTPLPVDIVSFAVEFDGRPARLVLATDATELARAEEERRRAEERFRTLVEHLPGIVYIDEPDPARGGLARPVYVSPQVEAILGYAPAELLADPDLWLRVVHPEDRERVEAEDLRTESEGTRFDVEYRALARDGRVVWFHDVAVPLEEPGGGRRWMGVMLDVSARKRAEEELAAREAHLRLLLAEVPAVLWSVDRELRFTSSEGGGLAALGLRPGEVVGRTLAEYFGTDDPDSPAIAAHRRALEGEPVDYELVWAGRTYHSHVEPLRGADGTVRGAVGVAIDLTDRKAAEEELRRSYELLRRTDEQRRELMARLVRAQEEERRRIAADVHDDAVQKMTAVGLRLEALARRIEDPEGRELLARLQGTVTAAIGRLRSLLFELRPPALDRAGLADALREHLAQLRDESGISVDLEDRAAGPLPEELKVTAYRIAQEALANVRKHARAGSVRVVLDRRDGGLLVRVADDGVGFVPDAAQAAEPGHLGLEAMRERAEQAGGWLQVRSRPGAGTTVEAWLPLAGEGREGLPEPTLRRGSPAA